MNVERLHRVLAMVSASIATDSLPTKVERLRAALEQSVGNPSHGPFQQEVSSARDDLMVTLAGSEINSMPALDREILDELGVSESVGALLASRIEASFSRNEVTPAVVFSDLGEIQQELNELVAQLTAFLGSVAHFGLPAEELASGMAELAVLIPRKEVNEEAWQVGRELQKLDTILAPFQEMAGGSPQRVRLAAVSSSDYGIYLDLAPVVALTVANAISFVLDQYKKVLEIRDLKSKLDGINPPTGSVVGFQETASDALGKMASEAMREAIQNHVEGLDLTAAIDDGRGNELRAHVKMSYIELAKRVDRGFNFDVRVGDEEVSDDEAPSDEQEAAAQQIRDLSSNFRFVNRSGSRILELEGGIEDAPAPDDGLTPSDEPAGRPPAKPRTRRTSEGS